MRIDDTSRASTLTRKTLSAARRPTRRSPTFKGLSPRSVKASSLARASSKKYSTRCETILRKAARNAGLKFKTNYPTLPGTPDLVFSDSRLAVFCDGDFWHGRRLEHQISMLAKGHNAAYWVAKIQTNVARDTRVRRTLRGRGWSVMRIWESDIVKDPSKIVRRIERRLADLKKPTF